MSDTVTIEAKVVGQRRPVIGDWSLPVASGPLTLRELIEQVVRAEVAAIRERRSGRRLVRVLSPAQIDAGSAQGKVAPGAQEAEPDTDPETAVATALLAFEDGLYYVFIDSVQQESLDAVVTLRAESRVTFLRLVALAGG